MARIQSNTGKFKRIDAPSTLLREANPKLPAASKAVCLQPQDPAETLHLVWENVQREASKEHSGAFCIALVGELGTGKTTLAQGLGKKLGIIDPMTSPTFLLMKEFALKRPWKGMTRMYHFDWYRLRSKEEIQRLGWDALVDNRNNFIMVEWADKFPDLFVDGTVWVYVTYQKDGRMIKILVP